MNRANIIDSNEVVGWSDDQGADLDKRGSDGRSWMTSI